eukprot:1491596-Rhodomonas_salina.5
MVGRIMRVRRGVQADGDQRLLNAKQRTSAPRIAYRSAIDSERGGRRPWSWLRGMRPLEPQGLRQYETSIRRSH